MMSVFKQRRFSARFLFQDDLELVFAFFDIDLHDIHFGVEIAVAFVVGMIFGMRQAHAHSMMADHGAVVLAIGGNRELAFSIGIRKSLLADERFFPILQRFEEHHDIGGGFA